MHGMLARKNSPAEARNPCRGFKSASTSLRTTAPNDWCEQEADRVAEEAMADGNGKTMWSLSRISITPRVQRKCACSGSNMEGGECEECKKKETLHRWAVDSATPSVVSAVVHEVLNSPGQPLDEATHDFFKRRLSHDFSKVRIHSDAKAAESAKAVRALAYTVGQHVAFDTGWYKPYSAEGRRLLAHELAHTMQQQGIAAHNGRVAANVANTALEREANETAKAADSPIGSGTLPSPTRLRTESPTLQKYEAGEHAQFGETGDILRKTITDRQFTYKVRPRDTLKSIAAKFKITEAELRAANSAKFKQSKDPSDPKKKTEGFAAGETITIPPVLNEATKEALRNNEISFSIKGVTLPYGEGITMGDFFESPEQMLNASPAELQELSKLIQKEKAQMLAGGKPINPGEWQRATGGRFAELALENEPHYAPSNKAIAPASGKSTGNHKAEWEKHHEAALHKSQAGDKDTAMATNAFADHFLTDAFAGGHLFNRADVAAMFEGKLPKNAKGTEFTAPSKAFFDDIAKRAFVGNVQKEFSKEQTVACFYVNGDEGPCSDWTTGHADINSASRLSSLLQKIHLDKPSLLESAVIKGIHDTLNKQLLPVENARHDKWELSGDGTLNADSRKFARQAVAQSQLNVLDAFRQKLKLDLPALFKKVWDFVPYPMAATEKTIQSAALSGSDPKSSGLISAAVALINDQYKLIIAGLEKLGKLQKKP